MSNKNRMVKKKVSIARNKVGIGEVSRGDRPIGGVAGRSRGMSFTVSARSAHALAVAHLDVTGQSPLDYPSLEPDMPSQVQSDADVSQILFCKLHHINSYRKDLLRRNASGQNVTTYYADATNEADECLAKIQAIANGDLSITKFPSTGEIQTLTTAMKGLEKAIAVSDIFTTIVGLAEAVISTIPAKNVS